MIIPETDLRNYIEKLRKLSNLAANDVQAYIDKNGYENRQALIEYTQAVVTKYGEASATLSANMYDAISEAEGLIFPAAEVAPTATFGETAKAVNGSLLQSPAGRKLTQIPDRLVKQASADTMLRNVKRDHAEWAWVPEGETCPFCIALASRGWQPASAAQEKGRHASHIHAHCNCQFVIRHSKDVIVEGYDPEKYYKMYRGIDVDDYENPKMAHPGKLSIEEKKLNALRRALDKNTKKSVLTEEQLSFIMNLENNPSTLGSRTPAEWKQHIENLGFTVTPLKQGSLKGIPFESGGGYGTNYRGDGYFQYHPSAKSHHEGAYYKTSDAKNGTRRWYLDGTMYDE